MDRTVGHRTAGALLYPSIEPYDQRMVDVGDGHIVYVEQCGNPEGVPVVVLHGGPGGGCSPALRRYFDPEHYRIILFDQRGCGRSRPHAGVEANTTWHLVRDIEKIRRLLKIRKWIVFGGSWGAALGLVYAQRHHAFVRHLVLRGVFLIEKRELDWFYGGGAGVFWPEAWARFVEPIPPDERDNLIAAYSRRLFSGDRAEEIRFARLWAGWENGLATIESNGQGSDGPADYARAFSRLENHYFVNSGFVEEGQILRDAQNLHNVGVTIVQGRFDMICPPLSAVRLHQAVPHSQLRMVQMAGHAVSEPGITAELVNVMNELRNA